MPASNKTSISADFLYKFQPLSAPRIAPDGKAVVFSLQRVDQKTEKKYSNLWIIDTFTENSRQFTFGDQKDVQPHWSPDGEKIVFLSNRADKDKPAQIYIIPFHGGEACQLSHIEGEINSFSWSPDGKTLLCSIRKTDSEQLEREKDEQKKKLGTVERVYNRLFYKLDGEGYLPHERTHIWTINVQTGKATQLTDHPIFDEIDPSWSPDGKWITFFSNRSEDPDLHPDYVSLFIMPSRGGEPKKLDTPLGEKSKPTFSPDGKWIAYIGVEGEFEWYKNHGLWVVSADGSTVPQKLTEKYDIHVSAFTINDLGGAELMPPTWSQDGKFIYFQADIHGATKLMKIDRNGDNLESVIEEKGVVGSFSFDREQKSMSYFLGNITDPCQVYLLDVKSKQHKKVSAINKSILDKIDLGSVEEIWYKGAAGNDLQGWIVKPPSFDPTKKYPAILEIHGGPLVQYGSFFMHEFYYLAAQGYVVFFTNPRGGRGYGEKHAAAIWQNWGTADYDDLMKWTDYVSAQPYIDTERLGVTGGSYGGYMTNWIISHTNRFKAAVSMRCVSNFLSEWGSSDLNWTFQVEIGENKLPFDNLQKFWDQSPIKYFKNVKTPTLVIHNENDHRCPIEQGEQVYVALKMMGIDSEFVRFPEEFHGLSRSGRTDRRIARLNHILRWFNKYLKP